MSSRSLRRIVRDNRRVYRSCYEHRLVYRSSRRARNGSSRYNIEGKRHLCRQLRAHELSWLVPLMANYLSSRHFYIYHRPGKFSKDGSRVDVRSGGRLGLRRNFQWNYLRSNSYECLSFLNQAPTRRIRQKVYNKCLIASRPVNFSRICTHQSRLDSLPSVKIRS